MNNYRAWDIEKKRMCPVWSIGWKAWDSPNEVINYVEIERDGTVKLLEHEVVLMQFTGKKDKYGEKIWEKDIREIYLYCPTEPPVIREVVWKENMASFDITYAHRSKVIGNRYETPELLNLIWSEKNKK